MGFIFSTGPGPFDTDVEKVTPEEDKGSDDWATMLDICDRAGNSSADAKDCLKSIIRRLGHQNPHVCLKAMNLLDICVKNCSKTFHLEVASREFEQECRRLLKKYLSQPSKLAENLKFLLKEWAENEFKTDAELCLIPELYAKLKQEGVDFNIILENPLKSSTTLPKNPNLFMSQQELDDIAKAIELSLKETGVSSGQISLYPSVTDVSPNSANISHSSKQKKLVKALYDFEVAEDNELTFYAGELIEVLDDSDKNWWSGATSRGEGLFPANFVTSDLTSNNSNKNLESKSVNSKNENRVHLTETISLGLSRNEKQKDVVINEHKMDRLLNLLHEANPTDESTDTEEMLNLEEDVNAMGPHIDTELEKVDRRHAQLTQLSSSLVDALNLYHSLMREPYSGSHVIPVQDLPYPQQMMYNNSINGSYSLPSGMMSNQYLNPMPGPLQPSSGVSAELNQSSLHFLPIVEVPISVENFHPPDMMANPQIQQQSYHQSLDPHMVPMSYNIPLNQQYAPPQMLQNFYQPTLHNIPAQERSSPGTVALQNNNLYNSTS